VLALEGRKRRRDQKLLVEEGVIEKWRMYGGFFNVIQVRFYGWTFKFPSSFTKLVYKESMLYTTSTWHRR
jgi:hypothetical protein